MVASHQFKMTNVASAESGIDSSTAVVARKLPRNSRIMMLVSDQTDQAFVQHRLDRFLDEYRLIEKQSAFICFGISNRWPIRLRTPFTT